MNQIVILYNIFIISFDTLCFMHLVSGHNLKKNLANFFNESGHELSRLGRVDS